MYLDRHEGLQVSPEELAEAHQRDLEVQEAFGVVYHSYWFDPANGNVFCLAEGPNQQAVEEVHRQAHGVMPSAIIEPQLGSAP